MAINYDQTTKKKTFCIKHQKYCIPVTGSWHLTKNGWECSEVHIPFPEFVPVRVKEERVTYANDQLQRTRGGEWSREFFEAHPQETKKMLKAGAITKEEIKKSKYVWSSDVKGVRKKVDAEALIK